VSHHFSEDTQVVGALRVELLVLTHQNQSHRYGQRKNPRQSDPFAA